MNYLKQIRYFWKKAKRHSFSTGEIALYFYLLECSNTADWQNPVWEPNAKLQQAIGVTSYNALNKYRNRLQQLGLLKFKSNNGIANAEYNIYDVELGTFSKNEEVREKVREKVCEKVYEEVREEVDDSVLYNNKQKPKQNLLLLHPHQIFLKKLFSVECESERKNIAAQFSGLTLTPDDLTWFNQHLETEGKKHDDWREYISHLRNWLGVRPKKEQPTSFRATRQSGAQKQTAFDILEVNQLFKNGISDD